MKFCLSCIPLFFVSSLILFGCQKDMSVVTIISKDRTHNVYVEVARTDEERRIGLMKRPELDEDTGMLFVYDNNSRPVMWMKNMLIPIDILFIDHSGEISHIEREAAPCRAVSETCATYSSPKPSEWVLELPAGFAARKGIQVGDLATSLPGVE